MDAVDYCKFRCHECKRKYASQEALDQHFRDFPTHQLKCTSPPKLESKNQIIRNSWGSRSNFQASYGLRMTPEDLEKDNSIIKSMMDLSVH